MITIHVSMNRRRSFAACMGWIDAFREYAPSEAVVLLLANRRCRNAAIIISPVVSHIPLTLPHKPVNVCITILYLVFIVQLNIGFSMYYTCFHSFSYESGIRKRIVSKEEVMTSTYMYMVQYALVPDSSSCLFYHK